MEPLVMDLRVSKVAPMVEGNLVELVSMVKQMGRNKDDLTESQNRKMVGYLGNLDEMRSQIVIMVQRYEDDSKVLKRLLELLDRIDDVRVLAVTSESSQPLDSPAIESDMEITRKYDTPFNPLMVSTLNILDVSGLFADNIKEEDLIEEVEEGAGDEYWDHDIDHSALAPANDTPQEVSSINLSVSSMHLPDLFDSGSHITPQSAPSSPFSGPSQDKGKGKSLLSQSFSAIEAEMSNGKGKGKGKEKARDKGKGKGKGKRVPPTKRETFVGSDSSASDDEDDAPNGASSSWKSAQPGPSSSSKRPTKSAVDSDFGSETESGTESESESSSSESSSGSESEPETGIPPAPPLPRKKKGSCDPVLCKICYDEYTMYEHVYEFSECKHAYCNECLGDYLVTHINEGAVLDLVCPFPDCTTEVLPTDIKALCKYETIAKYERFTVLAALRADPNARWCPNPYCNNGIKHNPATMPWVYCSECKFEFCFHCMAERHEGVPCGEPALAFLKKKQESEELAMKAFETFAEAMHAYVKPCPGCKAFIEKNDGCNHMTCGNPTCRTQFCWLCLNLYTADHFMDDANFPDCYDKQYYTPYDLPPRFNHIQPRIRRRRFANVAKKVGIYVGVGVAVVTLGVPAAVIGGPVYGAFQLHKRLKAKRRAAAEAARVMTYDESYNYNNPEWVPPSPQRIAEAAREARRLYDLEHS